MKRLGEIALFTADVDRLVEIDFFVDDVDAENRRLGREGVEAQIPPRDFSWGRSAYYRDPDGRQVELHLPPRSPDR